MRMWERVFTTKEFRSLGHETHSHAIWSVELEPIRIGRWKFIGCPLGPAIIVIIIKKFEYQLKKINRLRCWLWVGVGWLCLVAFECRIYIHNYSCWCWIWCWEIHLNDQVFCCCCCCRCRFCCCCCLRLMADVGNGQNSRLWPYCIQTANTTNSENASYFLFIDLNLNFLLGNWSAVMLKRCSERCDQASGREHITRTGWARTTTLTPHPFEAQCTF